MARQSSHKFWASWLSCVGAACCITLSSPGPLLGQSVHSPIAVTSFVAQSTKAETENGFDRIGVVLDIPKGWKSYWRTPGASGVPTQFEWTKLQNVKSIEILWPIPKIDHDDYGLSYVYSGETVIPLKVIRENVDLPAMLEGNLFHGACADVCLPVDEPIAFTIEPNQKKNLLAALLWHKALEKVPAQDPACQLSQNIMLQRQAETRYRLELPFVPARFYAEGVRDSAQISSSYDLPLPQQISAEVLENNQAISTYELALNSQTFKDAQNVRLTLQNGAQSWEILLDVARLKATTTDIISICNLTSAG